MRSTDGLGSIRVMIALLLVAGGILRSARADPCGMVPPMYLPMAEQGIVRTGLQQTYVFYRGGIETIVIHPGFEGNVDEFGMLIPFPATPDIRKVADATFAHIQAAIDPPEVVVDLRPNTRFRFGMGGYGGYGGGMGGGFGGRATLWMIAGTKRAWSRKRR